MRPWKRKVKESKEGKGFHQQRESGLEEEWCVEMDLEDEAESRDTRELFNISQLLLQLLLLFIQLSCERVSGKPEE